MTIFSIFQDGGRQHLGFCNFEIFYRQLAADVQDASPCQILLKLVKRLWRYGSFSIFQDNDCTHLGFVGHILEPPTKSTWLELFRSLARLANLPKGLFLACLANLPKGLYILRMFFFNFFNRLVQVSGKVNV